MMIELQSKEIIQINTGIIASALVFLTLSSIASTQEERWYRLTSIVFGVGIIVAFSISSLLVMNGNKNWALLIMKYGFLLLILGGVAYAISNYEGYLKSIEPR